MTSQPGAPPPLGQRHAAWRRLRVGLWRLRKVLRLVEFTLARRFGLATREDQMFFLLIPGVGLIAGLLGVVVHRLIDGLKALLWGHPGSFLEAAAQAPRWLVVGAPLAGGLIVGLIVWASREPVSGKGMGFLVEAVVLKGGRIPPRPILLRAVSAVATVGSGGALGREGPMIRLGAMISSWLGERLGLSQHRLKILVGCGAAAGLAAAYNIPVGGAIFAMEVILGNFALEIFGPIVVSSVISTLLARAFEGNVHTYPAPAFELVSRWEILAYAGLGLVGAAVSVLFVFGVRGGGRLFDRLAIVPPPLRPVLGMALLGLSALYLPQVLGSGFEVTQLAIENRLPVLLLFTLPFVRLLATAVTAGSGGAGGLFAPSLAVGALVGGAYGSWIHGLLPEHTATPGAYAAVGMAAIAAGTSHAPISAILILFEFTGNYDLILPLMVAAILSSLVSRRLYPHSLYTEALEQQGIAVGRRLEETALAGVTVEDLLRADPDVLKPDATYRQVVERFFSTHRQRLFVVDGEGRLLGAISLHDIKQYLDEPESLGAVVAHDLMLPVAARLRPEDRLHEAARVFAASEFERLPVVEGEGGTYRGVVTKRDLLAVYAQEVLGRPAMLATFVSSSDAARDYVELPPDFAVRLVPVPEGLAGLTLAEARLPQTTGVRVIEIKRDRPGGAERVIPGGDTVLRRRDQLIVLGPSEAIAALERMEATRRDEAQAHLEVD